jgi:hypothetical protein
MLTVEDLVHHLEGGITTALVGCGDDRRAITRSLRAARGRMLPPNGLPRLPDKGATLAAATDAAAAQTPTRSASSETFERRTNR